MYIRLAGEILHNSLVNGEGFRTVLFCSGCRIKCKGCHNPETHDFNYGKIYSQDEIIDEIKKAYPLINGVTFSGGDPMDERNAGAFARLARRIKKELGLNIWCYTGQIHEEILKEGNSDKLKLLNSVDVLVDSPFIEALNGDAPKYVGSSNQRIIKLR